MITDKLSNIHLYPLLARYVEAITAFARKAEEENLPVGKYELMGDELFAMVQCYTTKPAEEGRMESHRIYTDLQYVMAGTEELRYAPVDMLTVEEDQTPAKDMLFYKEKQGTDTTRLLPGMFTLYLPTDGHMPQLQDGGPAEVHKIVFKIKI